MREIESIKQALAAGPTPGPWHADNKFGIGPTGTDDDQSFGFVLPCAEVLGENIENDARYIAAVNPAAMAAVLAHIDEQAAEIEQLRPDAGRYRKLRAQHWWSGTLAVVRNPKESVRLGGFCPSHDLLDAEVDLLEDPK